MKRSRSSKFRSPRRPWVLTAAQVVRSRFGRAGEWATALARRASLRTVLKGRPGQCGDEFAWSDGSGSQRVVCGNAWVCPACSLVARREDEERISGVVGAWQARGGSVVMVTLTPGSHSRGDGLDALLARLDGAWRRVVGSRRPWRAFERQHRIGGLVRVLEVERGRAGWHPHFHVLVLVDGRLSQEAGEALVADVRARWCAALAAEGSPVPTGSQAVSVSGRLLRRPERGIPAYLAKGHFDLLGRLALDVAAGDADAIEAVQEFQGATRRRKRVVVTREVGWLGRVLCAFRKTFNSRREKRRGEQETGRILQLTLSWLAAQSTRWAAGRALNRWWNGKSRCAGPLVKMVETRPTVDVSPD